MKIRETEFYGGLLVAAMALAWWSIHVPAEKKNQTEVFGKVKESGPAKSNCD